MTTTRRGRALIEARTKGGNDVDRLAKQVERLDSKFNAAINSAGALAAGALAAGGAFASLASEAEAVVDEVNTLAAASGLSVDTVNGLRQAAKATGKSLADLLPEKLPDTLNKYAQGSKKAERAFNELGVAAVDSNGQLRASDAVYRDIIDALNAIEDPTKRAALATQVLGKQGQQLLSAFDSSDALDRYVALGAEFGFRVGPEAAEATAKWQAATAGLNLVLEDVAQLTLDALGGPEGAAAQIDNFSRGVIFTTTLLRELGSSITDTFQGLFDSLLEDLRSTGAIIEALLAGDLDGFTAALGRKAATSAAAGRQLAGGEQDPAGALQRALEAALARVGEFNRREIAGPAREAPRPTRGAAAATAAADPLAELRALLEATTGELEATSAEVAQAVGSLELWAQQNQFAATFEPALAMLATDLEAALAQQAAAGITGPVDKLTQIMEGGLGAIVSQIGGPIGVIAGAIIDLVPVADKVINELSELVISQVENLPDILDSVLTDTLPRLLGEGLPRLLEALGRLIPDIIQALIVAAPQIFVGLVTGIVQGIVALFRGLIEGFKDLFTVGFERVGEGVTAALEMLGLLRLVQGTLQVITDILQGLGRLTGLRRNDEGERRFLGIRIPQFQDGTRFVGRTGLAVVHRGESITPRGGAPAFAGAPVASGGPVSITINGLVGDDQLRRLSAELRRIQGVGGLGESF